jgi:hypothetical protein
MSMSTCPCLHVSMCPCPPRRLHVSMSPCLHVYVPVSPCLHVLVHVSMALSMSPYPRTCFHVPHRCFHVLVHVHVHVRVYVHVLILKKIPTATKSKKSTILDTLLQTQNGIDGKPATSICLLQTERKWLSSVCQLQTEKKNVSLLSLVVKRLTVIDDCCSTEVPIYASM